MNPWFDPAGFSVRNWQFTAVVLVMLTAIGASSWFAIPRAEDPSFDAPNFGVVAVWPGAAPGVIEGQVLEPLVDRFRALDGVKHVKGTASDGGAVVEVEFLHRGASADDRYGELLREIDAAGDDLPDDVANIEVRRFRPSSVNVMQLALVSDTAPLAALRTAAEAMEAAVEAVPGVSGAVVAGLPEERIDVQVDADALAAVGLPVGAVLQALTVNDARIPGGHVDEGRRRLTVTTESDWATVEELEGTVVAAVDGAPLRLGQIATVERRHADVEELARLDGRRALWLSVTFDPEANVFRTRDAAFAAAESVRLPEGASLHLPFDQSANVAHRLAGFGRDFGLAIALVLLTLLPLGPRASGVVMVAIPLSLAMGLTALQLMGYSINQLSIVGFVIALGLLVDDAIVVVENIARHLRRGKTPMQAAIDGSREITLAVLGCTATLVLAFLPLVALPGTAGLFIRVLPVTVVVTILASLVLSLTVVPLLASRFLKPEAEHGNFFLRSMEWSIERSFRPVLGVAMRWPKLTLLGAAGVFAASLALVPSIGFSLFPKAGIPMFRITVETGAGGSLTATDGAVRAVEAELARHPEVTHVLANVGAGNPRVYYNVAPANPRADVGEVLVRLTAYDPETTPALLDELRTTFAKIPGAKIAVREFENGPPVDAPVAVRLLGEDLDALGRASAQLAAVWHDVDGLYRIDDPLAFRRTDLAVTVDRAAAGERGVAAAEIARTVRFALAGLEVGELVGEAGEDLPVVVRAAGEPRIDDLSRLHVARLGGGVLPLGEVATVALQSGPTRINHYDGARTAVVTADVRTGFNTDAVGRAALARLDGLVLPDGVRWQVAGEAESRAESFSGLGRIALIAVFGMLAVLVLEFRSFASTLVVASVVPLGVAGGLVALWLTGNTLSFTASIGFVALMGIEVKNSILLVDFANQLREEGMALGPAIARAGETRFVPIVLTTATALGGLVPLALEGSALYSPLAIVLIGGLLASTALARVVTPVAYALLAPPIGDDLPLDIGAVPA
jgi:multidrug efflux pump subunit AcrB